MRNQTDPQIYEVKLPLTVCDRGKIRAEGTTHYISKRDVRFVLNEPGALRLGGRFTLFVGVPAEITGGYEVFIRADGHLQSIDYIPKQKPERWAFTVAVKRFAFVRNRDVVHRHEPENETLERRHSFLN